MKTRSARRGPTGAWLAVTCALLTACLGGWAWLTMSRFEGTARTSEALYFHHGAARTEVERLRAAESTAAVEGRSYLLTGFQPFLEERARARRRFQQISGELRGRLDDHGRQLLGRIDAAEAELDATFERAVAMRKSGAEPSALGAAFVASQQDQRRAVDQAFTTLRAHEESLLAAAHERTQEMARRSLFELTQVATCALLLAGALAFFLTRAFRAARRHEADLALLNEDLDAFAGRVAHDLRSVLAGLPILAATLRRSSDPEGPAVVAAARIDQVTKRAKGVIDGLLAFSRAGQAADDGSSAQAAEVAADAIDDLSPLAQAGCISVEADLEQASARCAPALLHVALMNLLSNAIKFSAGQTERRVRVRTRSEAGRCVVAVEDSGPGIAPEALPHVFEPFYRAPGSKTEGVGLGLATVRRIVEAHGGGVDIQSTLGRGTVAKLWFPIFDAAATPKPPPAANDDAVREGHASH